MLILDGWQVRQRGGGWDGRGRGQQRHRERVQQVESAGRLVLAGPFPAVDAEDPGPAGFRGSLTVAEFDSEQAAREWADTDPYVEAGVYERVTVRPFRQVFPQ